MICNSFAEQVRLYPWRLSHYQVFPLATIALNDSEQTLQVLSPVRRQTIIWSNADLVSIETLVRAISAIKMQ